MKIWKNIPSIVLIGILTLQSALFGAGMMGVSLVSLKKICTCNHSISNDSISPEDELFKNTNANPTLKNSVSGNTQSHKTDIPSCHSTTNGDHGKNPDEAHFCPHEKSKQVLENSAIALTSILHVKETTLIRPDFQTMFTIQSINDKPLQGYNRPFIRPPQF